MVDGLGHMKDISMYLLGLLMISSFLFVQMAQIGIQVRMWFPIVLNPECSSCDGSAWMLVFYSNRQFGSMTEFPERPAEEKCTSVPYLGHIPWPCLAGCCIALFTLWALLFLQQPDSNFGSAVAHLRACDTRARMEFISRFNSLVLFYSPIYLIVFVLISVVWSLNSPMVYSGRRYFLTSPSKLSSTFIRPDTCLTLWRVLPVLNGL